MYSSIGILLYLVIKPQSSSWPTFCFNKVQVQNGFSNFLMIMQNNNAFRKGHKLDEINSYYVLMFLTSNISRTGNTIPLLFMAVISNCNALTMLCSDHIYTLRDVIMTKFFNVAVIGCLFLGVLYVYFGFRALQSLQIYHNQALSKLIYICF